MDKRLYLFDLDDTLIQGHINPRRPYADVTLLPNRKQRLHDLIDQGRNIAFVTNQRGVAFGYYTLDEMLQKFDQIMRLFELEDYERSHDCWYVCVHDVRGHWPHNDPEAAAEAKPSPALIERAISDNGASRLETIMIGDRPDDQAAADAAGISFMWAHAFFCDKSDTEGSA